MNKDLLKKEKIFIIGYPKSGNTWLSRLIADATDSNIQALNIYDSADNSLARQGNFLIYKRHTINDYEKIQPCKIIYIVRDIRDVLVSAFFFSNGWCSEKMFRKFFLIRFYFYIEILLQNNEWQGNMFVRLKYKIKKIFNRKWRIYSNNNIVGNWSNHLNYWINQQGIFVVRYEDLVNNTEYELNKILSFLDINIKNEKIKKVVENQSFKNKLEKFKKSKDKHNIKFLRNGKSGNWKFFLNSYLVNRIQKKHQRMMDHFNYE